MRKFRTYACVAASLLLCVVACALWMRSERVTRHLSRVSAVSSPMEERQAFQNLSSAAREHRWSLQMRFFDTTGANVGPSGAGWPKRAATVELTVNGQKLRHRVLDGDNLFLLMGE